VTATVTAFKHQDEFSRKQAAELLTDIAYGLVAGGPLAFRIRSEQIEVPIADELVLACRTRSNGGRTELELRLSSAFPTTSGAW
jgi:amphi-Trp domain-containing protein